MSSEFTIEQVVQATGGEILQRGAEKFVGVGTDSRRDLTGQIFVALKGETFDGHQFLEAAVKAGALALIVHQDQNLPSTSSSVTIVRVKDTLEALQDLASNWRSRIQAKVVAISGSNGKTTTKEFSQAILSQKFKMAVSPNSFNNHWGVPISLLSVGPDVEVAVLEMGMNHSGELRRLCEIARPDVALITMVGRAHIGELGSQQAIVAAKEELYQSTATCQIFNLDNEHTIAMHERARTNAQVKRILTFSSFRSGVDVSLRVTQMELGSITVTGHIGGVEGQAVVPVFGRHNISNLMAASAVALAASMKPEEIWPSLAKCHSHWGRNQMVNLKSGAVVLFDAYNANPESMAMLMRNFFEVPAKGKKVAVIGEMLELGAEAENLHRELGELVGKTDLDLVWFIGSKGAAFKLGLEQAGFKKTSYFSDGYEQTLAKKIASVLNPDDIVVIKGSRGMRLERVLEAWDPVNFEKNH